MKALSDTELVIAEWYCHGLTDKEIADVLEKPDGQFVPTRSTSTRNSVSPRLMSSCCTWYQGTLKRIGTW